MGTLDAPNNNGNNNNPNTNNHNISYSGSIWNLIVELEFFMRCLNILYNFVICAFLIFPQIRNKHHMPLCKHGFHCTEKRQIPKLCAAKILWSWAPESISTSHHLPNVPHRWRQIDAVIVRRLHLYFVHLLSPSKCDVCICCWRLGAKTPSAANCHHFTSL